jgi:DNA primase (bacterial type)
MYAMTADISEAKRKLPLPALIHRLGLGEHAKKSARCPFHEDKHNSFSIWPRGGSWFWKCHTGCGDGDEITLLEKHYGISNKEATKLFLEMAGVNGATSVRSQHLAKRAGEQRFDWQHCVDVFTGADLEQLAEWRGYSIKFCHWLKENGFVGLYDGCIAFPVQNRAGNIVAAHYRLKDGSWRYYPQGTKMSPLVIGELVAGGPVHLFESYWDAFAFMDKSGERSGIIITRGASNGALLAGVLPHSATVYCWTQNDAAGEKKWERDICVTTKAAVKRCKIPAQHKDLNDWTRAGATDKELLDAMLKAEIVHEAEKTWVDALNESVVTSSELYDLELKLRKKLLGDWFCEGDLGFIFAFRGVGKTWLALAIAQALSSGGKLGDWQAHERVTVLYIDGEMPPDLMLSRCKGLEASNNNLQFLNHEILFDRSGKVLNITNREIQDAITEKCIANGVKVLFLDNLSTLASGMRENEADSWELVNSWLLDLRRRKIAVVIVHHAGRSGEMRGTSKREDNVFWIIALDDTKKNADDKRGARFISRFTKPSRNTQEDLAAYEWHFVTDSAAGEVSISHQLAQTMDVFLGLIEDGVRECNQIAQEMKTSPATISRLAKRALDAGKIIKKSREYFLAEGEKFDKKS